MTEIRSLRSSVGAGPWGGRPPYRRPFASCTANIGTSSEDIEPLHCGLVHQFEVRLRQVLQFRTCVARLVDLAVTGWLAIGGKPGLIDRAAPTQGLTAAPRGARRVVAGPAWNRSICTGQDVLLVVDEEIELFAREQLPQLLRTAYLLTGRQQDAEDLVQDTLVKVWTHWRKVSASREPDKYVNRVLINLFIDTKRRRRPSRPGGLWAFRAAELSWRRQLHSPSRRRASSTAPPAGATGACGLCGTVDPYPQPTWANAPIQTLKRNSTTSPSCMT